MTQTRVSPSTAPFFTVLVTAYNRAELAQRCVRSCVTQTFEDFEVLVVDDGSSDDTVAKLTALDEPRLRIVRHSCNQGYIAARATGVDHAHGEWIVMVDSDDELLPHALARLRAVIDDLPPDVHVIRSCQRLDDGRVTPSVLPPGLTDYHGRLQWLDAVATERAHTDAGHCMHRSVFAHGNYFRERRGVMEPLWELNLARRERSLWLADVLGLVHNDAPNRHSRDRNPSRLIRQLLAEAPDQLWMAETILAEHGRDLALWAPHYRRWVVESAAVQSFLVGDRYRGLRRTAGSVLAGGNGLKMAATAMLGIISPKALAYGKAAGRQWRAWRVARP